MFPPQVLSLSFPALVLLLLGGLPASAQEPAIHLHAIRSSKHKPMTPQGAGGDSAFLEYVLRELVADSPDSMFISDRSLLSPLCVDHCSSNRLLIRDSIQQIEIRAYASELSPSDSLAFQRDAGGRILSLGGLPAYGALKDQPRRRIDSLSIHIRGRQLLIPQEAYAGLFEPNFCDYAFFTRGIEAYPSLDQRYLYLYIYGGEGPGMYFAKLIFDRERYLRQIVAEYPALLRYRVIGDRFIGY
jgi:hypothetical protein